MEIVSNRSMSASSSIKSFKSRPPRPPRPPRYFRKVKQRLPAQQVRLQIPDDGSWKRNSLLLDFTGIHSSVGRVFRRLGQFIDDPLDNFIGRIELRRLGKQLDQLSPADWAHFPELVHADMLVQKVVECIRYVGYNCSYCVNLIHWYQL
jgi:hypothetical protein